MTFYGLMAALGEAETEVEVRQIAKKAKDELHKDDYASLAEAALLRIDTLGLSDGAKSAQNEL